MGEESRFLMQEVIRAWEKGAEIYKDESPVTGLPEFGMLFEDSEYMMDVEDDETGSIVRINFQKLNKDII